MRIKRTFSVFLLYTAVTLVHAEPFIDSSKAAFYVGQEVMVCGVVADVKKFSKGTYLNLGAIFPKQHLSVIVWDTHLSSFTERFGTLNAFKNQRTCARGKVENYKNTLQIQVSNPQFLRLMK